MVGCGVVWCGVVWCGVVWCDEVGVVWCDEVWCGVVWCGVVWCGVVWCGVETRDGRDSLLQGQLLSTFIVFLFLFFSCREISRAGSLCMCCVCV